MNLQMNSIQSRDKPNFTYINWLENRKLPNLSYQSCTA